MRESDGECEEAEADRKSGKVEQQGDYECVERMTRCSLDRLAPEECTPRQVSDMQRCSSEGEPGAGEERATPHTDPLA